MCLPGGGGWVTPLSQNLFLVYSAPLLSPRSPQNLLSCPVGWFVSWDHTLPGSQCAHLWNGYLLHAKSLSVMSDSLWPHGLQHARLPCPSPSPGVCTNSCSLTQWCHPTISSSVTPFFCSHWSFYFRNQAPGYEVSALLTSPTIPAS